VGSDPQDNLIGDTNTNAPPTDLMQLVLLQTADAAPLELACVFKYSQELNRLERVAERSAAPVSRAAHHEIARLVSERVGQFTPESPPLVLDTHGLNGTGFQSALLIPLAMPEQVIGLLGLFAAVPHAYTPEHLTAIEPLARMARVILENERLTESLITARSILETAHAIAENPSIQEVVNILHDYLCPPHITSCAILLYGPVAEGRMSGPFNYLELKGSWSKRRGSGVALGLKFSLLNYPDLLEQLDEHKILVFDDLSEIEGRFDPFIRAILKVERFRSMAMLALHAEQVKLGVIILGTDRRHEFAPQELRSYQTVSEFLAISAMAQNLQQQHDMVQRGRAALLDAVTDGVVMILPEPGTTRVLTVNRSFLEMFNLPRSKAEGIPLLTLLDRMQLAENARQQLRRTWLSIPVRDPATQRGEFSLVHPGGFRADIEWYSAPVYQGASVMGRIYMFHDVTAERTAIRVRSTFLSRVSHELRTPLTSIRGFAEFILEAVGDELPDLAREYTQIILNSAKHLNHVFTDMIEITRADAGELKLNLQEAHLPDIIIEVVARLELQYKQRGQTVVMELDDELPSVNVDVERIAQVLTNLVTNSIKYSPENGKIRLTTRLIDSPQSLPDSAPADLVLPSILVIVADEGGGLTTEELDKVFLPFFRTETARVNKIEGTGLGLAVARSIIELHGGKIWAEARRRGRKGGYFLFTLPALRR
jgi:signal transduction histidine kinase